MRRDTIDWHWLGCKYKPTQHQPDIFDDKAKADPNLSLEALMRNEKYQDPAKVQKQVDEFLTANDVVWGYIEDMYGFLRIMFDFNFQILPNHLIDITTLFPNILKDDYYAKLGHKREIIGILYKDKTSRGPMLSEDQLVQALALTDSNFMSHYTQDQRIVRSYHAYHDYVWNHLDPTYFEHMWHHHGWIPGNLKDKVTLKTAPKRMWQVITDQEVGFQESWLLANPPLKSIDHPGVEIYGFLTATGPSKPEVLTLRSHPDYIAAVHNVPIWVPRPLGHGWWAHYKWGSRADGTWCNELYVLIEWVYIWAQRFWEIRCSATLKDLPSITKRLSHVEKSHYNLTDNLYRIFIQRRLGWLRDLGELWLKTKERALMQAEHLFTTLRPSKLRTLSIGEYVGDLLAVAETSPLWLSSGHFFVALATACLTYKSFATLLLYKLVQLVIPPFVSKAFCFVIFGTLKGLSLILLKVWQWATFVIKAAWFLFFKFWLYNFLVLTGKLYSEWCTSALTLYFLGSRICLRILRWCRVPTGPWNGLLWTWPSDVNYPCPPELDARRLFFRRWLYFRVLWPRIIFLHSNFYKILFFPFFFHILFGTQTLAPVGWLAYISCILLIYWIIRLSVYLGMYLRVFDYTSDLWAILKYWPAIFFKNRAFVAKYSGPQVPPLYHLHLIYEPGDNDKADIIFYSWKQTYLKVSYALAIGVLVALIIICLILLLANFNLLILSGYLPEPTLNLTQLPDLKDIIKFPKRL